MKTSGTCARRAAARHRRTVAVLTWCTAAWLVPATTALGADRVVVVYTALDRGFSEPILQEYQRRTGTRVRAVYDTESTKTIGLVNRIRAEKRRPRCDVFWNNEIVNTLRLKEEGLLQPCFPDHAKTYPQRFKDAEGTWYGFAARARVLIVNNRLLPPGQEPRSIFELGAAHLRGRVGIAKPLFGTTASHMACLFAALGDGAATAWLQQIKSNDVQILAGNRMCAQAVGREDLHCALTDTDDAALEIAAGSPVRVVYLDSGPKELGTLFIPNTVSLIKGAPHPGAAVELINYLLSPDVERALAQGPSAQIPLNRAYDGPMPGALPEGVKIMEVDLAEAARRFDDAARYIANHFLD